MRITHSQHVCSFMIDTVTSSNTIWCLDGTCLLLQNEPGQPTDLVWILQQASWPCGAFGHWSGFNKYCHVCLRGWWFQLYTQPAKAVGGHFVWRAWMSTGGAIIKIRSTCLLTPTTYPAADQTTIQFNDIPSACGRFLNLCVIWIPELSIAAMQKASACSPLGWAYRIAWILFGHQYPNTEPYLQCTPYQVSQEINESRLDNLRGNQFDFRLQCLV